MSLTRRGLSALFLCLSLALLLAGCGGGEGMSSQGGQTGTAPSAANSAATSPASSLASVATTENVAANDAADLSPDLLAEAIEVAPSLQVGPSGRLRGVTTTPWAMSPAQVRQAYGFSRYAQYTGNTGKGQTIAIVVAYGSPTLVNDYYAFCRQYSLPTDPPLYTGYPGGKPTTTNSNWALETVMDAQWAHAIAPEAKIIVVITPTGSMADLLKGVDYAVACGATVVSMSWGSVEFSSQTQSTMEGHFTKPGVTFIASAGDNGAATQWPACSPNVLTVGGTSLTVDSAGNVTSETAWSGSGGGRSKYQRIPTYQQSAAGVNTVCGSMRGVPDVAYSADNYKGFSVYTTTPWGTQSGWMMVGGTSAGVPQWAGLVALVNAQRAKLGKTAIGNRIFPAIYSRTAGNFRDITSGSNGFSATTGFDLVTGVGRPCADLLIPVLASY